MERKSFHCMFEDGCRQRSESESNYAIIGKKEAIVGLKIQQWLEKEQQRGLYSHRVMTRYKKGKERKRNLPHLSILQRQSGEQESLEIKKLVLAYLCNRLD